MKDKIIEILVSYSTALYHTRTEKDADLITDETYNKINSLYSGGVSEPLYREVKASERLPENTTLTYFYKSWSGGLTYGYYEGLKAHLEAYIKEHPNLDVVWLEPIEITEGDEFGPVDLTDVEPDKITKGAKPISEGRIVEIMYDVGLKKGKGATNMMWAGAFPDVAKAIFKELNNE